MIRARKELITVEDTPFYHCISRCIRRVYLCGEDFHAQQNFDHRKVWLVEKIMFLASVFAIDVCAYAVMSNHYHVVLFIHEEKAKSWLPEEIMDRWAQLFPTSAQRFQSLMDSPVAEVDKKFHLDKLAQWQDNLCDISWFMRCLNESVARRANKEDGCKGRFWEGRFKSQALLDEKTLLFCMAYVDLNPVRAKEVASPEESNFTSIQERLYCHAKRQSQPNRQQQKLIKNYQINLLDKKETAKNQAKLKPLNGSSDAPLSEGIPFTQQDYIKLLDWTGRVVRGDKRGVIDGSLPPIFRRLGIEEESWIDSVSHFQKYFFHAVGSVSSLEEYQLKLNKKRAEQIHKLAPIEWIKGKSASRRLYG